MFSGLWPSRRGRGSRGPTGTGRAGRKPELQPIQYFADRAPACHGRNTDFQNWNAPPSAVNPVVAESPNVGRRDFPTPCDPHHALGENGPARYATLCSEMNATARSEFPCAGAVESEAVEAAQDRFTRFPREPRQGSPGVRNGTQSSPNGNQFVGAEPCYQNRVQQSALRASPSELSESQRTTMAKADIACRILLAGGLFLWTMP